MSIKDILVHVDNARSGKVCVALAAEVAQRFGAHLTGLYVKPPPAPAGYFAGDIGVFVDDGAFDTNSAQVRARIEIDAAAAESLFRDSLRRHQLGGDWEIATGSLVPELCFHARHADLAIVGRLEPGGTKSDFSAIGEILLGAGRPAIIVPHGEAFSGIGERILLAWQPTREAARAMSDALPLLKAAKSVTVIAIEPDSSRQAADNPSLTKLRRHFARHGIGAQLRSLSEAGQTAGERILAEARDNGADLIVAGAYGHSRLQELIFGGVTHTLLETSAVPLFMSH